MTPIQAILLVVALVGMVRTFMQFHQKQIVWNEFLLWVLLWGALCAVVALPDLASRLATLVGVGRGADLIIYSGLILVFYLLFRGMVIADRLDQDLTKLVTALALKDITHDKQ